MIGHEARMQRIAILCSGLLTSQTFNSLVMAGMADMDLIVSAAEGVNSEIERRERIRQTEPDEAINGT